MPKDVRSTINMFSREGLGAYAKRYLERYPESVDCLTMRELREQLIMHPDARPTDKRVN
jgi:hypothetical protein